MNREVRVQAWSTTSEVTGQAWSMTSEVAEVADCQGGSTAPEVADRWVLLEQNRKKC